MMTKQEIAQEYLKCFCEGNVSGLIPLLAPQLQFNGTFYNYNSAAEYLNSLRNDPPEKCTYTVLSITENDDSVAVFYEYGKPGGAIKIAQLFKIKNQKIKEILLIFDGRGF